MWRGVDIESVKSLWAEKLVVYPPEMLKYALDQCDTLPRPPSLPEFLGFCKDGMKHYVPPKAISNERTTPKDEAAKKMQEIRQKLGMNFYKEMP